MCTAQPDSPAPVLNPANPVSAVNLVHPDTFTFLTSFVYGADNKPTGLPPLLTADSQGAYSGGLYATMGTYYANPWKTGDSIPGQLVGSAQFKPSTTNSYPVS